MRRTRGAAAVLAGLLLALLPAAGPAWAHDGKLKMEVAGDGAVGVTVQARHADGHQLETMVRLALTATGADGRSVGPVQLEPTGEGHGFYATGPILAPGKWQVTVRAPAPHTSEVTVEVEARAAQSAPAQVTPVSAAKRDTSPQTTLSSWWRPVALGVLAVLAIVVVVWLTVRRREARENTGNP
ncbi:hypothetical protein Ait01nite_087930 [Actinoplanes italicus]|uniref:YtkA-like protein n=1 Tax=Actinoplanes italicus TaxID=113567 RepID=A0A2T0K4D9_9ACTN|nr:hypothetical protein [Actinoplanes italicus]PRX17741.1 hypothetical protein CLV67_115244 [Actinoplanes italicus]GIE35748.1 hypothetical protein Ait01nite_087930 [Actinoplanes italicus]